MVTGFSHMTCLPACKEAIASSAWTLLGVQMKTREMVSSAKKLSNVS